MTKKYEVIAGCKCGMSEWVVKGAPMGEHVNLIDPSKRCPESTSYRILAGRKA